MIPIIRGETDEMYKTSGDINSQFKYFIQNYVLNILHEGIEDFLNKINLSHWDNVKKHLFAPLSEVANTTIILKMANGKTPEPIEWYLHIFWYTSLSILSYIW